MSEQTIKVKCGSNGPVQMPEVRRQLDGVGNDVSKISAERGVVEVPNTRYYRQRIVMGDLVKVEESVADSETTETLVEKKPSQKSGRIDRKE